MSEMLDRTADYSPDPQIYSPLFESAYAPESLTAGGKYKFTISDSNFLPPTLLPTPLIGESSGSSNSSGVAGNNVGDHSAVASAAAAEDTDFLTGCWNVVSDLAEGAYEEIVENPYETALKVGAGIAVGVAAAFVAPVILTGAAIGAAVGVAYETYEHGGEWCDNITKVANPEDYSAAEVNEAHKAVKGMGAVASDLALGAVTGVAGSALAGVVSTAVRGAASAEASTVVSGAARGSAEADIAATIETSAARAARFPTEPPAGGKYIEIKVPKKDEFDPNLPLTEGEIAEIWGPQISMSMKETGFQIANKEAWAAELQVLNSTDSAVRVAQTANNWAVAIEERMAAGEPLTKELADRAFAWVNVDDNFDWIVSSALKDSWVHGKQLSQWY